MQNKRNRYDEALIRWIGKNNIEYQVWASLRAQAGPWHPDWSLLLVWLGENKTRVPQAFRSASGMRNIG